MTSYLAECGMCGWRSDVTDTEDTAAQSGLQHLAAAHLNAPITEAVGQIRVWQFERLQIRRTAAADTAPADPPDEDSTAEEHRARRGTPRKGR